MSATSLLGHIQSLLKQLDIPFETHEDTLFFALSTQEEEHYFYIKLSNEWVTLSLWNLMPPLDINDPKLSAFYISLLLDQDTTRCVKSSINVDNELELSIDLRAHQLSIESIEEALDNLIYVSERRLPQIVEPFIDIIFQGHLHTEDFSQLEDMVD